MIKQKHIRSFRRIPSLLCLLLALNLMIIQALALNIPEPTELFYVADYAGVLEQDTIDHIVSMNDALYAKTGAQVVIATVDFIDGADIEDYAYEMANKWGIGSAEKNNGVLLLLVIGEENYWAVQGKGLESSLPSSTLGNILYDYLEDDFAAGDYDAGVRKVFDAIYAKLESIYGRVDNGPVQNQPDYSYPDYDYNDGYKYNYEFETDFNPFGLFIGGLGFLSIIPIIIIIVIIAVVTSPFRRIGRGYYRRSYFPWWTGSFWGWGSHHHHHGPRPGPGPGAPPNRNSGPGFGGGAFRGGGAGRSSFSSGFRSSGGFKSGGSFGGSRGGGGGGFRGGGAGRK